MNFGDYQGVYNLVTMIVVIIGIVYIGWDKVINQKRNLGDQYDEKLITRLKQLVTEYEKQIPELTKQVKELSGRVGHLESENARLVEIFQGRDKRTQEFQDMGFKTMERFATLVTNVENLGKKIDILLTKA